MNEVLKSKLLTYILQMFEYSNNNKKKTMNNIKKKAK